MDALAKRLAAAREHRGLSQAELARISGVAQGTIGNAESGARKLPRELPAIAHALRVKHEWLRDGRVAVAGSHAGNLLRTGDVPCTPNGIPLAALLDEPARMEVGQAHTTTAHGVTFELPSDTARFVGAGPAHIAALCRIYDAARGDEAALLKLAQAAEAMTGGPFPRGTERQQQIAALYRDAAQSGDREAMRIFERLMQAAAPGKAASSRESKRRADAKD